jgi:hypothetical protein
MQPVVLDTDVASLLHRRKLAGPLATRLIGREPLITFGELAKWAGGGDLTTAPDSVLDSPGAAL